MKRTALVVGATGLVGSNLLQRLLHDPAYARVTVLARKMPLLDHPRLDVIITDFAGLDALGEVLAVDDVYCCLGTTLRRAGSKTAFADVDERMVVELAEASRTAGAQQFLVVSSIGASERALAFYSRVKGRMERAVSALGYDAVHILRPSLLLGTRLEERPGEDFAQKLAPWLAAICRGPLRHYAPVRGEDVAEAMVRLALRGERGVHIHHLPLRDD